MNLSQLEVYTAQRLYDLAPHLRGRVTFRWARYQNSLTLTLVCRGRAYSHTIHTTEATALEGVADEALHNTVSAINIEENYR